MLRYQDNLKQKYRPIHYNDKVETFDTQPISAQVKSDYQKKSIIFISKTSIISTYSIMNVEHYIRK